MNYYALFYREVVQDFIERRGAFREEHLGLAREAHARGELVLAGALANPPDGALLVFRAADPTPAEDFVRKDPYVRNGLVKRWEIRPWTVVVGNQ
ncbi:MAG: YciI-like protein [Candidatus Acidiferrum sp.]